MSNQKKADGPVLNVPGNEEGVSPAKVYWFSSALNAFISLGADYRWLMLFLGVFVLDDFREVMSRIAKEIEDPDLEEKDKHYYRNYTAPKRRLYQLTDELVDDDVFPGNFTKTTTYKGTRFINSALNLPLGAIAYYAQLLQWLFRDDWPLLRSIAGTLHNELKRLGVPILETSEDDDPAALPQAAAEPLRLLLRQLARKTAGPNADCPFLEGTPRAGSGPGAESYRRLLENLPSDTFAFYEALCALAQQGNPYALRELAAISRIGRRYIMYDGTLVEVAPDRAYAGFLAEKAGGEIPGPLPARLHKVGGSLSEQEQKQLESLADRGSVEAACLLARRRPADQREELLRPIRRTPACTSALKNYILKEDGTFHIREDPNLVSDFSCLEDAQLLPRLCSTLRKASLSQERLVKLVECYQASWGGFSPERRYEHSAPLCLLLPALQEAAEALEEERSRLRRAGWGNPEVRARIREQDDKLDKMDYAIQTIRGFLLEALGAVSPQDTDFRQLGDG